jgi:RNA polymerase sigma factor (sigma-70 family)
MEVSALKYSPGIGLHGRSPLLRLQSDERLIAYLRKGNPAAFEVLVARYETRLQAFCRHLLGSREDAEDVMQEVMTAAFNAILADERPINVRPWLYRIARNRSLNHLRRIQTIGVDSMDMHYSDNGASTADKVHEREEFRLLVGDIHELPETQKTALVLREMDALSYEQIAEAMETTVPSVKSLLVRARVSLAEAAEARLLSCAEVRIELGELAEGLRRRPSPLVRRHLRSCERCTVFRGQLKQTNKALAALMPIGPLVILRKLALAHLGHSAGAGSGATAAGSGAAGAGASAAAGGTALAGSGVAVGSGGFITTGLGAIAAKAAAGIAAAAIVTAGAVEADHATRRIQHHRVAVASLGYRNLQGQQALEAQHEPLAPVNSQAERRSSSPTHHTTPKAAAATSKTATATNAVKTGASTTTTAPVNTKVASSGRDQTQTDPTVMPTPPAIGPSPAPPPTASPPPANSTPTSDPSSTAATNQTVSTPVIVATAPVAPPAPVSSTQTSPTGTTPPTSPTGTTPPTSPTGTTPPPPTGTTTPTTPPTGPITTPPTGPTTTPPNAGTPPPMGGPPTTVTGTGTTPAGS